MNICVKKLDGILVKKETLFERSVTKWVCFF